MALCILVTLLALKRNDAFEVTSSTPLSSCSLQRKGSSRLFQQENNDEIKEGGASMDSFVLLDERFPTSVDDQVRQAASAIYKAQQDGITRHSVRMLLPLIGATELDDWPGGARQMMDAASPMVSSILTQLTQKYEGSSISDIRDSVIDSNDGVRALFSVASDDPKRDACAVLLPSADTISQLQSLDEQVGSKRCMIITNSQWKRKSDFGGVFGSFGTEKSISFVNNFEPIYYMTSLMVDGEQIRILRAYPGQWRVFLMKIDDIDVYNQSRDGGISWVEIGTKPLSRQKSNGKILDFFDVPSYEEISDMIRSADGYIEKTVFERAIISANFIKDTL
eukprot:CAMPEP_0116067344 /NCGR_PEP_ID=MMETSP0322-20121206/10947_1 /TAXON_ID=163516 /ORGANISM="Leptocylindrus danicus var. apora, Strain B651" /LENGTH=335 /DNA_ID=CAMNT_0003554121 /DNA_START=172 /DNA_END=1179 /DNA_ORIENTATION=+